ncbi:MAG TPA: hypothetical protein VM942_08720 [Acidimicrobiales bacterium]|nr:hypothetical protein [Acidimicrobiales bacterium]
MNTIRTRIIRLTFASALTLGLGVAGAGPALAGGGGTTLGEEPAAVEDGATPEPLGGCIKVPKLICMF